MQDRLLERRSLLALGTSAVLFSLAKKGQSMATEQERKDGKGQPGEFDFLIGDWKIKNRRLKGPNQWDEFEGESTCWSVLNGVGSIEELRIPARNFFGMGLRLLDRETGTWSDYWIPSKNAVLSGPGQQGGFKDGVGTFISDDMDGNAPVKVKGVWDQITPQSCRWYQAISRDDGKTWEDQWIMHWTRSKPSK